MRCVGIDVHRDFCEIAVYKDSRTRSLGRIETSQEPLQALAESLNAEDQVAIETTGNARRIAEILGVHASVLIVDTRNLRAITHAKLKNDRMDAQRLAERRC